VAAVGDNQVSATGSLKTVNDKPTVSVKATVKGTLDGDQISGSGKASAPLEFTPVEGGGQVLENVTASGSAKENGVAFTDKETVTIPAETNEVARAWNLQLSIAEKTDPKGKTFNVASLILNLPNGDKTGFKEKKVTYSIKKGYSITFSGGVKLDAAGNPKVDLKGKPILDRKSRIVITKMKLVKTGGVWKPTEGTLSYQFLGQKGSGDLLDFF
jgi:hypothetical protein